MSVSSSMAVDAPATAPPANAAADPAALSATPMTIDVTPSQPPTTDTAASTSTVSGSPQQQPALSPTPSQLTALPPLMPFAAPPQPPIIDPVSNRVLTTVERPFLYGTAAYWLGKAANDNSHSHRWTVFVRGLENESLSAFIKSVTFTLHSSFEDPVRVISAPPYECTETGWGEFTIAIAVDFIDSALLPPLSFQHFLKLFPPPNVPPSTKRPVMSETYDEFVFVHPTVEFYQEMTKSVAEKLTSHPLNEHFLASTKDFAREENMQLARLSLARGTLTQRIERERMRLFAVEQQITQLTQRIE